MALYDDYGCEYNYDYDYDFDDDDYDYGYGYNLDPERHAIYQEEELRRTSAPVRGG